MDADGNGTVTIMFNYTADDDRAWFKNIADTGALELVTYDQYHKTLNDHLTYTKDTELITAARWYSQHCSPAG